MEKIRPNSSLKQSLNKFKTASQIRLPRQCVIEPIFTAKINKTRLKKLHYTKVYFFPKNTFLASPLHQPLQLRVGFDAGDLGVHEREDLLFDLAIVRVDGGLHRIVAGGVAEVGDDRDRAVGLHLSGHFGGIDHNLRVEDLLFDTLVEVVGDGADKHALRQVADFRGRDQAVHLCVNRGGNVLPIDGDGLPSLQDFAEPFGERLGSFSHHLS